MYILHLTKIIIIQYNCANCFYREVKPLTALIVIINNIYYFRLLKHIVSKINSSYIIFIKQFSTLDINE